ncbi:UDP-N-acetylmuramoyl-tripeptide--D-alanyl-D-alanine ligase [Geobacter sp. OR-1]|uniref:UDP-N-acetylmuramoyl-tripeptide--D-alanyl-D- alanine ligase n=1 Tax=Geobacter sp. OR-1 TaxID=1266765 RepID=UPI0005438A3E|nr:UDP-N-acetylmuramoyl-tripeptide--D-alanyl-D-alanine ligase [Geobacter sp. OR-1]GAM09516.1 UDP-N-acetylmuramoyl-tripeptide--D-alanyl-D-alanine ligase [Geobacter sp. OR-1]
MTANREMFVMSDIQVAVCGRLCGDAAEKVRGVSTDSRTVQPGELFIPLRGERFNGHDYIAAAVDRGVTALLAEETWVADHSLPENATCIVVPDTLRALGDLAASYRRRFDFPLIGVTGSNGKTTVKEMIATILAVKGAGLKTAGNLNNLIGLPRMIFQASEEMRWGVLEMGMSEPGEIDRLAGIAAPSVGVITNVFPAHLESMGSLEAVARAKGELFMRLQPGQSAVYNCDDQLVAALPVPEGVRRISFGMHGGDVTAGAIEKMGHEGQRFALNIFGAEQTIRLRAFGRHNIQNALAAAAATWAVGITPDEIAAGLERFDPVEKRFRLEKLGEVTLIDDSYNANPGSMAAGLVTLSELKGDGRAIAVLGDMLELGSGAMDAHRGVGRLAATCACRLYLMGRFAETVKAGALDGGMPEEAIVVADDHEQLLVDLRGTLQPGDCVLVKGSRGMRMETIAEGIRNWCALPHGKGAN